MNGWITAAIFVALFAVAYIVISWVRADGRYTKRARIALLATPVIVVWFLCALVIGVVWYGLKEAAKAGREIVQGWWQFWYRDIYRVARYGSVRDS